MSGDGVLQGQVAVVTGGSRGIGRAICVALAAAGADLVVAASRDMAGAEETVAAAAGMGRRALARQADVSRPEQAEALVAAAVEELGRVDILINNAGVTRDGLIMRMSDEDWDSVLDTNLKGAFYCCRSAVKRFIRQRSGRIVNITSINGITGAAGQANYAASKAGLIGLTKSIAREVGGRSVTCNAVAPGWIKTQMTADLPAELAERVTKQAALGRLGEPEDIAGPVVFLCSPAASFITGQVLIVDGGLVI